MFFSRNNKYSPYNINQRYAEAVVRRCSVEKVFLEISQNSQENTYARVSFLIKLQACLQLVIKEALAQVFSCEFCEISIDRFNFKLI